MSTTKDNLSKTMSECNCACDWEQKAKALAQVVNKALDSDAVCDCEERNAMYDLVYEILKELK